MTFLVTALNEEPHIASTVDTITRAAAELGWPYEIILIDDGSTDATGGIMDRLAAANPNVKVVHNERNLGLGGAYKRGLSLASNAYVMWVCGDDSETAEHIVAVARHAGEADIVIPVLRAGRRRPLIRRITSKTFVTVMNALFGLRVGYYNGTVVHRTELIRRVPIRTDSFAYQAEALVKLLKAGCSYVEVPYQSHTYDGVFSNATKPKNLLAVLSAVATLVVDIHFRGLVIDVSSAGGVDRPRQDTCLDDAADARQHRQNHG